MSLGDPTVFVYGKVYGLYLDKQMCKAELSTSPILIKPMAEGFIEHKDLL
jgi:hypothetical protein